jgi:deazaflavin-dependent oxidoreductase (nitroreductase family)
VYTPPRWLIPWVSRTHVALYRLTGGRIGARLAGKPGILLRTIGRRTGRSHTVCLPYFLADGHRVVVAAFAGAPRHPDWLENLRANPHVVVQEHGSRFPARAEILTDAERDSLWASIVVSAPWYEAYQRRTARRIPLVRLRVHPPSDP